MNDEELEARLRATLKAKASDVVARPDAWEEYSEGAPLASAPVSAGGRRMVWLSVAAAAALIVFVVVRATSSPSVTVNAVAPETTDTSVAAPTTVSATTTVMTTTIPPRAEVPADFAPTSVTFVSLNTGWVLGTTSCESQTICTALVQTRDGGKTWAALPAPRLSADVPAGARHVRFGNLNDGWIYGPDLWVTHDGGLTWAQPSVEGLSKDTPVYSLETDGTVVHAVFISGSAFTIITSPVDRDAWRAAPTTVSIGAGPVPLPQLVVQGSGGWILENDRVVVGGARLDGGQWKEWQPPCTDKGGAAVLTASTQNDVVAVCNEGIWTGAANVTQNVFVSTDGGASFHEIASPLPGNWNVEGVASSGPDTIVIAGATNETRVLEATFDGGRSWSNVHGDLPKGSWTDFGFTGPTQGIAIVSTSESSGRLVMTTDGGRHWSPVDFHAGR